MSDLLHAAAGEWALRHLRMSGPEPTARPEPTAVRLGEAGLRLFAAAQHHARTAIREAHAPWSPNVALDIAVRLGAVVELLAKALLASCDVRLIAPSSQAHHHLMDEVTAARQRPADRPGGGRGRSSVAAADAVALASRLDHDIAGAAAGARRVLDARNAAAHLAVPPDGELLEELVGAAVAFANATVARLGEDIAVFWADYAQEATDRLQARERATRDEALRLVEEARDAFLQLRRGRSEEEWESVVAALTARSLSADLDAEVECPACGHDAHVQWSAEADGEYSDGEYVTYGYWALDGLRCQVCNLVLEAAQLDALDLEGVPDVADVAAEVSADWGDSGEYWDDDADEPRP